MKLSDVISTHPEYWIEACGYELSLEHPPQTCWFNGNFVFDGEVYVA